MRAMPTLDLLLANLLQPIVLAFLLGAIAGFVKSELELPEAVIKLLSIYLLFSLGLTGGRELARAEVGDIVPLVAVTLLMTFAIPTLAYAVGATVECAEANTDPAELCGAGLHVATLDWCLREWREGFRILLIEFRPEDIACIPHGTDGKFRLHQLTVVRDITDDLRATGALPALAEKEVAA